MKPVTAKEIKDLIKTLTETHYDPEAAHMVYDDILERYSCYPDSATNWLIRRLIKIVKEKVTFWYS